VNLVQAGKIVVVNASRVNQVVLVKCDIDQLIQICAGPELLDPALFVRVWLFNGAPGLQQIRHWAWAVRINNLAGNPPL
jgi:hypothetical protein